MAFALVPLFKSLPLRPIPLLMNLPARVSWLDLYGSDHRWVTQHPLDERAIIDILCIAQVRHQALRKCRNSTHSFGFYSSHMNSVIC
jgi:hypothetical protein